MCPSSPGIAKSAPAASDAVCAYTGAAEEAQAEGPAVPLLVPFDDVDGRAGIFFGGPRPAWVFADRGQPYVALTRAPAPDPLQNVVIRKVKVLKKPKFDLIKLMECHGDSSSSAPKAADDTGDKVKVAEGVGPTL